MKWEKGRQSDGYAKMKLWAFGVLKNSYGTDCYLIKYPPHFTLQPHTDPVEEGKKHFRLNIVLKGSGKFFAKRCILKFGNKVILFRPDENQHSMINGPKERLVFSLGIKI